MIEPSSSEEDDDEFGDSADFGGGPHRSDRGGGAANNVGHKISGSQGQNGTGPRLDVPNGSSIPR